VNPIRRLSESLREMRWTQLVLELALLVIGILIALAVDGWMDDRRDAQSERRYLELLVRDLDRDLEVLDEFLAYEERQVAESVFAYRALRTGVAPRPAANLGVLDGPAREFAERVAMPIETANDRLWQLPPDSPERAVLVNKVWIRGHASTVAIAHAARMAGEIREVREAVVAELARRWPS
jgi:hypothetical protein